MAIDWPPIDVPHLIGQRHLDRVVGHEQDRARVAREQLANAAPAGVVKIRAVGSSSSSTGGFPSMARARAIRWRCPDRQVATALGHPRVDPVGKLGQHGLETGVRTTR